MIIEKVTEMYFDQYLKESVFDICDMKSTGYYELDKLPAKCANNYIYCSDTNDYCTNIFSVYVKGTGAGGAFITAKDIISFWTNLLKGNLICFIWGIYFLNSSKNVIIIICMPIKVI